MSDEMCIYHGRLRCEECLELEGLWDENAKLRAALERVQELASQRVDHWMIRDVAETALACDEGDKT